MDGFGFDDSVEVKSGRLGFTFRDGDEEELDGRKIGWAGSGDDGDDVDELGGRGGRSGGGCDEGDVVSFKSTHPSNFPTIPALPTILSSSS